MNNKESYLYKVAETAVRCCATKIDELTMSLTIDDVLGKSKAENVVMTRCILVMLVLGEGYSVSTLAQMLHRTPHAIRNLQAKGYEYASVSRAFRIAAAEATLAVEKLRHEVGL